MISTQHTIQLLDEVIKERQQLWRAIDLIIDHLFDGLLVVFDRNQQKILKVNDPYCILSGGYGQEILDQPFIDLVPSFQRVFDLPKTKSAIKIKIPFGIDQFDASVYCFDTVIVILIDQEQFSHLQEIEITRLKALVSRSEESALWITDVKGTIKDVSSLNISLNLGFLDEEVLGFNIQQFSISEEEKSSVIQRVCKSGSLITTDVVHKKITMTNGVPYILHLDTYL